MKRITRKGVLWGAGGALALSAIVAGAGFAQAQDEQEIVAALPAPSVIKAINAAVEAKAGNVSGVEVETEDGATHVEVEIVAADGKSYEVTVDSQTGKIVSVEAEEEEVAGAEKTEMTGHDE